MPKKGWLAWQPYPVDDEGTPIGAVITACENDHVAIVAAFPPDRHPTCWAPRCQTPLRRISRQAADRIHTQARLAHELREAS